MSKVFDFGVRAFAGAVIFMSSTLASAVPSQMNKIRPPRFEVGARHAYFTIMSYNVQGLPKLAGITQDRYLDIGLVMNQMRSRSEHSSVVLLQEAFVARTREIRDQSGYSHFYAGPTASEADHKGRNVRKILNGGLWAMSDFPITKSARVAFEDKVCRSWDCFAAKGAQAIRVKIEGVPFEIPIVNTHVQAGGKYDAVRKEQFKVLWDFTKKFVASDEPVFVIGDFNTFANRPSYDFWLESTKLESVNDRCLSGKLIGSCEVVDRNGKGFDENPDHHFFRNGRVDGYNVSIEPVYVEHLFHQPYRGRLLSDHWGYNVTYEIKW